jgi:hypothetical protein
MKCPKCGYISFDFNQVCPKCNKNISDEQVRLNLPSFRPDPPSLLGILTGEADESNVGLSMNSSESLGMHEMDVGLDDSGVIDTSGMAIDEEQDIEISLDQEDSGEFELSAEEEVAVDLDDISAEDTESLITPSEEEEGGEDISMDLGDISLEEPASEEVLGADESVSEEAEQEISLEDLSADDSATQGMVADEETVIAPDMDTGIPTEGETEEESEIELKLDDLKINETGELEIGTESTTDQGLEGEEKTFETPEESLDLGDVPLDEQPAETEGEELDLGDLSLDDSGTGEEETLDLGDVPLDEQPAETEGEELDLGDLSLDDSGTGEEESLDLGDASLEEPAHEDEEKTLEYEEPATTDESSAESATEETPSDKQEEFDLDSLTPDKEGSGKTDDEMTLNLDDLDLDLDDTSDK